MQTFLQSLYLDLQETGAQATASSGFLSSCLTSLCLPLQSPLADVPLAAGLNWQIDVARAVSIHVQANRHHWMTVRSLILAVNREKTVQTLLLCTNQGLDTLCCLCALYCVLAVLTFFLPSSQYWSAENILAVKMHCQWKTAKVRCVKRFLMVPW